MITTWHIRVKGMTAKKGRKEKSGKKIGSFSLPDSTAERQRDHSYFCSTLSKSYNQTSVLAVISSSIKHFIFYHTYLLQLSFSLPEYKLHKAENYFFLLCAMTHL